MNNCPPFRRVRWLCIEDKCVFKVIYISMHHTVDSYVVCVIRVFHVYVWLIQVLCALQAWQVYTYCMPSLVIHACMKVPSIAKKNPNNIVIVFEIICSGRYPHSQMNQQRKHDIVYNLLLFFIYLQLYISSKITIHHKIKLCHSVS